MGEDPGAPAGRARVCLLPGTVRGTQVGRRGPWETGGVLLGNGRFPGHAQIPSQAKDTFHLGHGGRPALGGGSRPQRSGER